MRAVVWRSFFLVFYGSNCFARMNMYYEHCMGIGACILEWAALLKNHLSDDKAVKWNAMRFLLAAMHLHYYSLNSSSTGPPINDEVRDHWIQPGFGLSMGAHTKPHVLLLIVVHFHAAQTCVENVCHTGMGHDVAARAVH
jgi:hypothetical protein